MRILGIELGIARAVGAILFSIVIGLLMHLFFRREEEERAEAQAAMPVPDSERPLHRTALYFGSMVAVLVFANLGEPAEAMGLWHVLFSIKWLLTGISAALLALFLVLWFGAGWRRILFAAAPVAALALLTPDRPQIAFTAGVLSLSVLSVREKGELGEWFDSSWDFAKQILPLLFWGVLVAGALLGRPGHEGLIPSVWVARAVGGNSILSNLFASVAGAFMYFATLTEVPIIEGLIGAGMGKGPALALLLAGPALSLPNMLVIRSIMGTRKTIAFVTLVVVMATLSGMIYGALF
jgi:uncharacterized membrane protein YraQ (UPF0718 family)